MIPRILQKNASAVRRGMTAIGKQQAIGSSPSMSHHGHRMMSNRVIIPSSQLVVATICANINSGILDGMASTQQRCYGASNNYLGAYHAVASEDASSNASSMSEQTTKSLCISPADVDDDGG